MTNPSTGSPGTPKTNADRSGEDHPTGHGATRTSVNGESSPRLPHERDESSDSGQFTNVQAKQLRVAKADAESSKEATDKSKETDATYANLRGPTPGKERDVGMD